MKSFSIAVVSIVLCSCWVVSLHGAAVEPVVEELETTDVKPSGDATPESELLTNEDCHQPKETGRCFALFYRFAYDVEKRECVEFIYGGCHGNSNNFKSKEECEAKCMTKVEKSDASADATAAPASDTTVVVPEEIAESVDSTTAAPSSAVTDEAR